MWIVTALPLWVYGTLFFAGIATLIVTQIVKILPYRPLVQWAAVGTILFATYSVGMVTNNDRWLAKTKELEHKIQLAEKDAELANTKLAEALAAKTKIVRETVYVYKDAIEKVVGPQIDATCTLPVSSIVLHDAASRAEVATGTTNTDGSPSGVAPSKLLETVVENYGSCHENIAKLKAWQEWYKAQKKIHEDIK